MGAWTVTCGSCGFAWRRPGNWSDFERQTVESRPCPCCAAYTLTSPEPQRPARAKAAAGRFAGVLTRVTARSAG